MTQSTDSNLPSNIGLSLSGGGYRAAGFHLGLLAYLDRINLLSQVKMISTVSGGTFTGAKYALSLVEGQKFSDFYREYYDFLQNSQLVEWALDKLGKKESNLPSGRTDLITAAAQVYAETFLKKADGKPYRFGEILNADIPLKEVVFNSTEFRYGIAFRFQRSANPDALIGNGKVSISKTEAEDIRIADIVAASSCFPGGFEPLAFPRDFCWSTPKIFEQVKQTIKQKINGDFSSEIALMDGGIYDNQGTHGLWLANKRNGYPLDLFVISDVDQKIEGLYEFPNSINISNLSLQWVDRISKILVILCVLSVVTVGYEAWQDINANQFIWLDIFLYLVPSLLATGIAILLLWGRNFIKQKIFNKIPQVGRFAWKDLKQLSVSQLANGIQLRITSLQAMAGSVFMRRIRELGLNVIYGKYTEENRYKIVSNFIYQLKSDRDFARFELPEEVQHPSTQLLEIIDAAVDMPTTLWFDEKNQLDNLIICGQATICCKLMVYITRKHGRDVDAFPDEVKDLWQRLLSDWNTLRSEAKVLS